ncbi:MAG: VOC family protein [Lachnospiraceae bacterium]
MIHKIDHMVITTANLPACIAFYKALGFRAKETGGRWELFSGDFKINVHMKGHELEPKAQNVQTGSADFCFEIDDDLVLYRNHLMAQEITVELGIVVRHGVRGEMQSIYLRDPDGNLIELCSYE